MFKAKEIAMKNVGLGLMVCVLAAGYFVCRPQVAARQSTLVFTGEEVSVRVAAKPLSASKVVAQPTVVASIPAPLPQQVAPLPIIPPSITLKVLPTYPQAMRAKELGGAVLLSVYVGLAGQVEKIETKVSSGVAAFDEAANKAVSQWKFSPAMQGGAALASCFEVPVKFELN